MQLLSGENPSAMGAGTGDSAEGAEGRWSRWSRPSRRRRRRKAPSPVPKARRRPEDVLWQGLYEQYRSPELRREFLPYQYFSRLQLLSPEQKLTLLIQELQETLAFSSRAKLHADWEWDLEAPSGDAFVAEMPCYMTRRPTSWGRGWNWMEQSKRRRARALSKLDSEFAFLAEQSTEQYLADAEAFADVQAVATGGGSGLGNGATLAAGAAGSTRTLDRHPSPSIPPPSPSSPSPSPFLTPNHPSPSPFPPAWHGDGRAPLLCRGAVRRPTRGRARRRDLPAGNIRTLVC
jgi:hypothetical protein